MITIPKYWLTQYPMCGLSSLRSGSHHNWDRLCDNYAVLYPTSRYRCCHNSCPSHTCVCVSGRLEDAGAS